jgi:hypothetical protein
MRLHLSTFIESGTLLSSSRRVVGGRFCWFHFRTDQVRKLELSRFQIASNRILPRAKLGAEWKRQNLAGG